MRKLILFILFSVVSINAYALTCPPVKSWLVENGKNYDVVPPPGWRVVENDKDPSVGYINFTVALWSPRDNERHPVSCWYHRNGYYDGVGLESVGTFGHSEIISPLNWYRVDRDVETYDTCQSETYNVNDCNFG